MKRLLTVLLLATTACGQSVDEGAPGPTDAGDTGPTVQVRHGETATTVRLSDLPEVVIADAGHARLSDVVQAALPNLAPAQIAATFVAADGFDPASRANCASLLPVAGETLAQGYIDRTSRNLRWEESLLFPGCMSVRDAAEIRVSDR